MATTTKTGGIHAPVQPSPELGAIVGNEKLPRSQVISKVWDYIKSNNLQNLRTSARSLQTRSCRRCSAATSARCSR